MANIFVDVAAGGSNNGTTWANAYTTVAGALAAANAGDTVYIAPGLYNESNLTPTNPGTAGTPPTWITYHGDYDESITDGGAATHGRGNGYIIIDGSGANGPTTNTILANHNNWKYHRLYNLYITGGKIAFYMSCITGGTTSQIQLYNCIGVTFGDYAPFFCVEWSQDGTGNPTILMDRCIGVSHESTQYANGFYGYSRKTTTWNANPDFVLTNCMFFSSSSGIYLNGPDANSYTYASITNCTSYVNDHSESFPAIRKNGTTYNKADITRTIAIGYLPEVTAGGSGSWSENMWYPTDNTASTDANYTKLTEVPLLPPIPYLIQGSPAVEGSTNTGARTDLFGYAKQGTYIDVGAQEYVANRYPKEPTMIPGTQDIPDIGNVTEDDTSDGSTGTYHEAAVGEVQNGVAFGAGSALTGTYVGSGGRPEIRGGNL